jgi:hypothetical protein
MSKNLFLVITVIIVLIVASVAVFYMLRSPQSINSTVTTGVKVGDVFIYQLVGFAESQMAIDIPENFATVNNTKY